MVDFRNVQHIVVGIVTTLYLTGLFSYSSGEGVEINGYGQVEGIYQIGTDPKPSTKSSNFSIQELDLIVQKDLGSALSTFIDLQFLNTYSTEKGWGDLNLDQMWIKYSPAKFLNIKFGHIVPTFNAFNEIKTKFPLLPYIIRPLVYESSVNALVNPEEFIPMHAALQINGAVSVSALKIDYALFGGNSDFIISSKIPGVNGMAVSGMDTTNYKLFGGRVGARISGLKLGFSYTYDKSPNNSLNKTVAIVNDNLKQLNTVSPYRIPLLNNIGESDRNRIGIDLSYTGFGLTLESEYIYVMNTISDKDTLALNNLITFSSIQTGIMGVPPIPTISEDLARHFFYVNASYDIFEKFFLTAGYSYMKVNSDLATSKYGITEIIGGGGYRMSDNVTLKVQCVSVRNDLFKDPIVKINRLILAAGASVYF
jgi:hypothetical protein